MGPRPGGPSGGPGSPRPYGRGPGGPGGGFGPRSGPPGARGPGKFAPRGPPRPPPTDDEVNALAAREHVPYRIARGELEGKMKCRIWRKLHQEEAKRFDQVYEIMGKNPGVDLADGFGILQSGLTPDEFKARKDRAQKKVAVRQARGAVQGEGVNAFVDKLVADKAELSIVLSERALLDVLVNVEPIAFTFERSGRLEKLQVVLMARRGVWEKLSTDVERDPKLAQKPVPVVRQPEKRPVSDPRLFEGKQGKTLDLTLRNGIRFALPLLTYGPFDLLLGKEGEEVFVPLHAILHWQEQGAASPP